MTIYEFYIFASKDCFRIDIEHMIQAIVMNYAKEKKCDYFEQQAGWEVLYRVVNETVTVFYNGDQYVLRSNEDFEDGNVLLDEIIGMCLKENYWIKLIHLSNVLHTKIRGHMFR